MFKVVRFKQPAIDQIRGLTSRDRDVVTANVRDIQADPRCGRPSGLRVAGLGAWQHVCPHSFIVLFRGSGGDPAHPADEVTIERIEPYLRM